MTLERNGKVSYQLVARHRECLSSISPCARVYICTIVPGRYLEITSATQRVAAQEDKESTREQLRPRNARNPVREKRGKVYTSKRNDDSNGHRHLPHPAVYRWERIAGIRTFHFKQQQLLKANLLSRSRSRTLSYRPAFS